MLFFHTALPTAKPGPDEPTIRGRYALFPARGMQEKESDIHSLRKTLLSAWVEKLFGTARLSRH